MSRNRRETCIAVICVCLSPRIDVAFLSECCEAFSEEATPHRIQCSPNKFPMDLVLVPSEEDKPFLDRMHEDSSVMMKQIFLKRN